MREWIYIFDEDNEYIAKAIKNGTPIPDNATNGDMLKAMFPNGITIDRSTAYAKQVKDDWWNSPYQKGGKDEN